MGGLGWQRYSAMRSRSTTFWVRWIAGHWPELTSGKAVATLASGDVVGAFTIHHSLPGARGGFGRVYLAHDALGVPVALKQLDPLAGNTAIAPGFFEREVAIHQQVSSDYVARLIAADARCEQPWIAYEFVDGMTLADRARPDPLGVVEACLYFADVARGLRDIHAAGATHRDLSPDNIMITRSRRAVVIDLGIASTGANSDMSALPVGKFQYRAPEQWQDSTNRPASDIWQLGVCLVKATAGHLPFRPHDIAALGPMIDAVTHGEPDLDGVPEDLLRVVRLCLAKAPGERPSAAQVARDLIDLRARLCERDRLRYEVGAAARASSVPLRRYTPRELPTVDEQRLVSRVVEIRAEVRDLRGKLATRVMFEPVTVDGATFSEAQVSVERLLESGVGVGDYVRLRYLARRAIRFAGIHGHGTGRIPFRLDQCPECGGPLQVNSRGRRCCSNEQACPGRVRLRLECAAAALGVGPRGGTLNRETTGFENVSPIRTLMSAGAVTCEAELFDLDQSRLLKVPAFRRHARSAHGIAGGLNRSGRQFLDLLELAKARPVSDVLLAAGVLPPGADRHAASRLSAVFPSVDLLGSATTAQILAAIVHLSGRAFGQPYPPDERNAAEIGGWFDSAWHREILDRWAGAGVRMDNRVDVIPRQTLTGVSVAVVGANARDKWIPDAIAYRGGTARDAATTLADFVYFARGTEPEAHRVPPSARLVDDDQLNLLLAGGPDRLRFTPAREEAAHLRMAMRSWSARPAPARTRRLDDE